MRRHPHHSSFYRYNIREECQYCNHYGTQNTPLARDLANHSNVLCEDGGNGGNPIERYISSPRD